MNSGKQSPAYFGTIPRTRLFLGVPISSAQWEEKNNLKARGEKKEPPKKTRDSIKKKKRQKRLDDFLLNCRKPFNWQALSSTELPGLSNNCYYAAVWAVFTYSMYCTVQYPLMTGAFTILGPPFNWTYSNLPAILYLSEVITGDTPLCLLAHPHYRDYFKVTVIRDL